MRTRRELGKQIETLARQVDALTHQLLRCIHEFDEAEAWKDQGATSCAQWLSWRVGWDLKTAFEKIRVARRLHELPAIESAMARGDLSYSKVRAITRVAAVDDQDQWLELASRCTGAELARKSRDVEASTGRGDPELDERCSVQRMDLDNGMVKLEIVLRPEEAERVMLAMETAAESSAGGYDANGFAAQPWRDRADGLMVMAETFLRGDRPHCAPTQVVVTVRAAALRTTDQTGDAAGARVGSTTVSLETARRLACDAGVVNLVEDERGNPLSVGRRTRTIPQAIKRALLHRDHTCRFPGCSNRLFVDGHHIKSWADGGETRLSNLVTLCSRHHAFVHDHHCRIELDATQSPSFYDRRGSRIEHVPTPQGP